METIRPLSDLKDNFADISKIVHETGQTVFLTKNGYGDMVVMIMEAFGKMRFESEICTKLEETELEAQKAEKRYSAEEVLSAMRSAINSK